MRKLFVFALVILLLSGCSAQDSSAITISQASVVSKSEVHSEVINGIDTNKIQGKIRNIFYVAQNQVLILADKLYNYDLVTNSILYKTDIVNYSESEFYKIEKGIAAIGTINANSQKDNISIVLYDNSLKKTAEISSSMFVAENEFIASPQQVAVSDDGKNIAFATNLGLYVYNIQTKTKATLIDLSDDNNEKRCGLAWIY